MQVKKKKLSEMQKNPQNVRVHSAAQINEYIRSLKQFGQIRPIVVDENGIILAGNGLYDALVQSGATEADVYEVTGLSENKKKKLMLADNRIYELGSTSSAELEQIVSELNGDFDIPGYNDEILELLCRSTKAALETNESYGRLDDIPEDDSEAPVIASVEEISYGQHIPQAPAQTSTETISEQSEASDAPPDAPREPDMPMAKEGRFVVCPGCGKKIWVQ